MGLDWILPLDLGDGVGDRLDMETLSHTLPLLTYLLFQVKHSRRR